MKVPYYARTEPRYVYYLADFVDFIVVHTRATWATRSNHVMRMPSYTIKNPEISLSLIIFLRGSTSATWATARTSSFECPNKRRKCRAMPWLPWKLEMREIAKIAAFFFLKVCLYMYACPSLYMCLTELELAKSQQY